MQRKNMGYKRAYLNQAQDNITDSTWTKVNLNAENYDVGADFDTANHRFVAPVSGYYMIMGSVGWTTVTDKIYFAGIYVNGALVAQSRMNLSIGSACTIPVHSIEYVVAGQYIELYCYHVSGANTPDLSATSVGTWLAVHLLSI